MTDNTHTEITIAAAAIVSVLAAVRLSRCTRIKTPCCECERRLVDDARSSQTIRWRTRPEAERVRRRVEEDDDERPERFGQGSQEPPRLPPVD